MLRILGLVLLFSANMAFAEMRSAQDYFFQPKLGDFKAELETAKKTDKSGVLLMFMMEECPFCARMESTILSQVEVQDYYRKHFLIYEMDVKGDSAMVDFQGVTTTEKAFALTQRARATPTFIFYDTKGNVITKFIGPTKDAAEFLLLGRYVVEGGYKQQPFSVYKSTAK
jgi:thioredoxin-related protein